MLLSEQLEEIELRGALVEWAEQRIFLEDDEIKKRIVKVMRKFPLFDLVRQEWDYSGVVPGDKPMEVEVYLNKNGDYIGMRSTGRPEGIVRAIKKRGIQAEKAHPSHSVCSIGKGADGKWYGWSHRAMVGFGKGDRVFDEKYGDDKTPFVKHGKKVITTDDDARTAAINFASHVS